LSADGTDAVFVRAEVIDQRGEIVPTAGLPIRFAVVGPGKMISPAEMKSEAGVASMLLQAAATPGQISIVAITSGLPPAKMDIRSHMALN